ncbi:MAG: hypothetical protein HW405_641 [Candidatus Berkelbacteria bacterium]|nr:hypothetical protein [Candidatus Berkelbacteria bacterium]
MEDELSTKAKIALDKRELSYLLGMIDIDLRYSKDKENIGSNKRLFQHLKEELDRLIKRRDNFKL